MEPLLGRVGTINRSGRPASKNDSPKRANGQEADRTGKRYLGTDLQQLGGQPLGLEQGPYWPPPCTATTGRPPLRSRRYPQGEWVGFTYPTDRRVETIEEWVSMYLESCPVVNLLIHKQLQVTRDLLRHSLSKNCSLPITQKDFYLMFEKLAALRPRYTLVGAVPGQAHCAAVRPQCCCI